MKFKASDTERNLRYRVQSHRSRDKLLLHLGRERGWARARPLPGSGRGWAGGAGSALKFTDAAGAARRSRHPGGAGPAEARASKTASPPRLLRAGPLSSYSCVTHCVPHCLLRFNAELEFWFCFPLRKKNRFVKGGY